MSEHRQEETTDRFQIVLLGTGSPSPSLSRHHPAAIVQWGQDQQMLVDAGDGVVSQLLAADIPPGEVSQIALTHMHWDHILGYPALVWGGWSGGRTSLSVIGPLGTGAMHQQLVEDYYRDQAEWAIDLGFNRAGFDNIEVRDVDVGWSEENAGCLVEAGPVHHPPMDALAYRFTYLGRSVVVTGDTAMCDGLIEFARDADVLVIDACAAPASPDLPPARRKIIERLHEFHASPKDCVEIATRANVGTVVLTHHLPGVMPKVDSTNYPGKVIIGEDLDVIII